MAKHPPFEKGNTIGDKGNRNGSPRTMGGAIKAAMNNARQLTLDQLNEIVENPASVSCDVIAARRAITAMEDSTWLGMGATTQLLDYTDGRPTNSIVIQQIDNQSPDEKLGALLADVHRSLGMTAPQQIQQVKLIESETTEADPD